jgi:hypothetical protein
MQDWASAQPGRQASLVIFQPGRGTDWASLARIVANFGLGLEVAGRRLSANEWISLESRWIEAGQDRYKLGIDWIEGDKP